MFRGDSLLLTACMLFVGVKASRQKSSAGDGPAMATLLQTASTGHLPNRTLHCPAAHLVLHAQEALVHALLQASHDADDARVAAVHVPDLAAHPRMQPPGRQAPVVLRRDRRRRQQRVEPDLERLLLLLLPQPACVQAYESLVLSGYVDSRMQYYFNAMWAMKNRLLLPQPARARDFESLDHPAWSILSCTDVCMRCRSIGKIGKYNHGDDRDIMVHWGNSILLLQGEAFLMTGAATCCC